MQRALLNCATIEVADTTDVSGRGTAESIKHAFCAKKQSTLCRVCSLTILGSVVSVGVLAALTPMPALGDEIADLKEQVAALQSQVQALQSRLAKVEHNNALLLGPFVTVDPNPEKGVRGPNITFRGANIHIVSGSGVTDDHISTGGKLIGLGNLSIGYDELFTNQVANRGGSHNLVVGRFNAFTSSAFGGLVAGEFNTISNEAASVSGGVENIASGLSASISGGAGNTASGVSASVCGGNKNIASSGESSVSGGNGNTASGFAASVSGGLSNTASSQGSSVSGGVNNIASALEASVSGGAANTAGNIAASVSGGESNAASGIAASVSGGAGNTVNTKDGHFP